MLLSVSFIDVSGGFSTSILDAIRNAVLASKSIYIKNEEQQRQSKEQHKQQYDPITLDEAFFMATLGGAQGIIQSLLYFKLKSN